MAGQNIRKDLPPRAAFSMSSQPPLVAANSRRQQGATTMQYTPQLYSPDKEEGRAQASHAPKLSKKEVAALLAQMVVTLEAAEADLVARQAAMREHALSQLQQTLRFRDELASRLRVVEERAALHADSGLSLAIQDIFTKYSQTLRGKRKSCSQRIVMESTTGETAETSPPAETTSGAEWPNLMCQRCKRYLALRDKTYCGACAQDSANAEAPPKQLYLRWMHSTEQKAVALRQLFLSKWYGRCGASIRVERIMAVFHPTHFTAYTHYQAEVLMRTKGEHSLAPAQHPARPDVDGAMHVEHKYRTYVNERRLFLRSHPQALCGILSMDPPQCCDSPGCELCQLLLNGAQCDASVPSSGPAVYLMYEPTRAPTPSPSSNCALPTTDTPPGSTWSAPPISAVEEVHTPPTSFLSTIGASAPGVQRSRHVCVLCRSTLGKVAWSRKHNDQRHSAPAGYDSLTVEEDGNTDVVIHDPHGVLIAYIIVALVGS